MSEPRSTEKNTFVDPDQLFQRFQSLGHTSVTRGHFELASDCAVRDLDWNHMDQHHRPHVHRTYREALRIATGENFATSLTVSRLFGIPLLILVADLRLEPGLYYQMFTLFNFIHVHIVIRSLAHQKNGKDGALRTIDWYIVSHPLFKFMHRTIDRRLKRLNDVQNAEDQPILVRRSFLRKRGFRFSSDQPDFAISCSLTDNVVFPHLSSPIRIPITAFKRGELNKAEAGPIELLIEPDEKGGVTVWTSACPHEGGPLLEGKRMGRQIQCPWHGLRFHGVYLTSAQPNQCLGSLTIRLDRDIIVESKGHT